jgi:ribosomal protein S18 acetylase RimI-like enzyme
MEEIKNLQLLIECLEYFDSSAPRRISTRVGSLEDYAQKLMVNARNYCVVKGGGLMGFTSFYANHGETAYLTVIAVSETSRGEGIGSKMLKGALDISANAGMKRMRLEVDKQNVEAIQFYEKHHFSIEKDTGEESVIMVKEIG